VVDFARDNLENERAWDVRFSLMEFAKEIFKDEFKEIEEDVIRRTTDRNFFRKLRENLWAVRTNFLNEFQALANQALDLLRKSNVQASDILWGGNSGLFTFFETCASVNNVRAIGIPSKRIRDHFDVAENWPGKSTPRRSEVIAVATEVIPIKRQLTDLYDKRLASALSAEVVLQNLYVFGLIADISRKLKEYKTENNVMLLADAPQFLNGVIQDSDTPFIYEKVGSFYKNYLIDEFQDTSAMQWKNFLPLLVNSMDQGYSSLVVGDVKQAIYRWRGGDLKLLQEDVEKHIGTTRTDIQVLNSNFRSSATIVNFNNTVFEAASEAVSRETEREIAFDAYRDVRQQVFHENEGFVCVKFLKDQEDLSWQNQAMDLLPTYLEQLQDLGVALRDVAILVRRNDEGQQIVANLLFHKNSDLAKPGYKYDVVSNESLRIDGASSVNLLLGAMR
jgi:ATP-dependent helicase/nuclease subunit A